MYDYFTGTDIVSGVVLSGKEIYGEFITGVVENLSGLVETGSVVIGSGFLEGSLISSPSTFRYWLLGILKSVCLWLLGYWYVPVIIVVVYCLLLFGYNSLWSYLLRRLQKKC